MTSALLAIKQELSRHPLDYSAAKEQARQIDEMLFYNSNEIEKKLLSEKHKKLAAVKELWIGLDTQSFQTPYSEIIEIVKHVKPQVGDFWVDLGAAYGRVGIVLSLMCPGVKFLGYEFVPERVIEGQRIYKKWSLSGAELKLADIAASDFNLDTAEVYFIYDFGSKTDVLLVLEKLRRVAIQKPITVIARGRGVKNWIMMDFPWLASVNTPEHFAHWSVFRS